MAKRRLRLTNLSNKRTTSPKEEETEHYLAFQFRDNIHSHFCHAKQPSEVGEFSNICGPNFRSREFRPRTRYKTGAGFPPKAKPSQLFSNNGRINFKVLIKFVYKLPFTFYFYLYY